ncbi:PilN domain-containing protein [Zoogloea dura]|uniref:PilN domain-containing protein n=1 Tax=Zoogloea dura TaxID=2728840 RepID=A0A848G569_9RHOO|nr:PilN domain-containing protein [Zoogloea dura]NML26439.1 PilN domain-containing protein [Zoogloea dura]
MIRINLLPHREEKRKARRQQFILLSALMALAGLVVWFIGHTLIAGYVDGQDAKNAFLKQEIAALDKDIVEIKGLREQAEALLSRKQVIESLQTNRTETVLVFNELARQLPEGVYLKALKQTGPRINLVGYAQSNARVSNLMRNLEASPHLQSADLVEVKAAVLNTRRVSEFSLNVSVERAKAQDGIEAKGAAGPGGKP